MASVTSARSTLIDAVDYEQSRVVSNAGPDPVEVSTDKHFTYGQGIRIPSGQSSPVVVHKGEALYARCANGKTATATLDGVPPDPAASPPAFTHLTEDAENTAIWASGAGWGVVASETEGDWDHTWSGHFADGTIFSTVLTPDANAIYVGAEGEAQQRLIVHGDGSEHWSDGENPATIHLGMAGDADNGHFLKLSGDEGYLLADKTIIAVVHDPEAWWAGTADDQRAASLSQAGVTVYGPNGSAGELAAEYGAAVGDTGDGTGAALYLHESLRDQGCPPDYAVVYTKDNGAGKTQLIVRFNSGPPQVLAIQA